MAATIALRSPGTFDSRQPDEWPKWKRRFVQYLSATGLYGGSDYRKISTPGAARSIVLDEIQPRYQPRYGEFQQNYMHIGGPNREQLGTTSFTGVELAQTGQQTMYI